MHFIVIKSFRSSAYPNSLVYTETIIDRNQILLLVPDMLIFSLSITILFFFFHKSLVKQFAEKK
jgi:hypothetical protein